MLTNAKELSAFMISRAKNMTYVPAIHAIMGAEWENEKTLADRATYLKANIEPLLLEVFKDKHHFLLPRFVATMPAPPVMAGPDGKPQHLPGFDDAGMSAEDRDQIWAAIRRYSQNGKMGEPMIVKSERDWFNFGLSEREMLVRVNFMRIYMDEFFKRMPKTIPSPPKPPAEAELAIMRAAVLKHRKPGDNYSAIIAKCMADRISIHSVGHEESYSGVPAIKIRDNIRAGHMREVTRIVEGLKAVPEGKGTMFDNTMIMYFPVGMRVKLRGFPFSHGLLRL
jgi:hypothetical protein